MPDRFNLGDTVKVLFNIKGSKWNKDGKDNYITNLDAWRMEAVALGGDTAPSDAGAYFDMPAGDPGDAANPQGGGMSHSWPQVELKDVIEGLFQDQQLIRFNLTTQILKQKNGN